MIKVDVESDNELTIEKIITDLSNAYPNMTINEIVHYMSSLGQFKDLDNKFKVVRK